MRGLQKCLNRWVLRDGRKGKGVYKGEWQDGEGLEQAMGEKNEEIEVGCFFFLAMLCD